MQQPPFKRAPHSSRIFLVLAGLSVGLQTSSAQPIEKGRVPTPALGSRQVISPDQVPEGLGKSDWASIRQAYEAGRHAFQPVPGEPGMWRARNPGQGWTTDPHRPTIHPAIAPKITPVIMMGAYAFVMMASGRLVRTPRNAPRLGGMLSLSAGRWNVFTGGLRQGAPFIE